MDRLDARAIRVSGASVRVLHDLAFSHSPDLGVARKVLAADGLAPEWRQDIEALVARSA